MSAAVNKVNQTVEFPTNINAAILQEKGTRLANLGKYAEALNYLEQAVVSCSESGEAWVMQAVVLIHLNRHEEALASCEKALELNSQDRQAWLFKGVALNYLGRYEQCYVSYDNALGIKRRSFGQKLLQLLKDIFGMRNSLALN